MMSIIDFCSICFPKKKSIKKGEKRHNGPKPNQGQEMPGTQVHGVFSLLLTHTWYPAAVSFVLILRTKYFEV